MRVALVLAAIVNVGLLVALFVISNFVFGHGPEGMRGDPWAVAGLSAMFALTLGASFLGYFFYRRGRNGSAVLIAWLPTLVALGALVIPPPY